MRFDRTMFLHEVGTALLLSDTGIHIQGTNVENVSVKGGVVFSVLVVTMRDGTKWQMTAEEVG